MVVESQVETNSDVKTMCHVTDIPQAPIRMTVMTSYGGEGCYGEFVILVHLGEVLSSILYWGLRTLYLTRCVSPVVV